MTIRLFSLHSVIQHHCHQEMFFLLLLFPILLPIYFVCSYVLRLSPTNRAVLITGCDSGFGRSLSIRLANRGFRVLSGCLLSSSLTDLLSDAALNSDSQQNLQPFLCDVTSELHIQQSVELVARLPPHIKLWCLVNNAGIIDGAFIHWTSMEQFHRVMNVNFFGQVAMIRAHLPQLIKQQGRIINMASILGFNGVPGLAAYCSSKFAIEGFSDCLRREMKPFGVSVSVVEPGLMNTAIIDSGLNNFEKCWNTFSLQNKAIYGEGYKERAISSFKRYMKLSENPGKVVSSLEHAVQSPWPRLRYLPGWQAKLAWMGGVYSDGLIDWLIGLVFPNHPDSEQERDKLANQVEQLKITQNESLQEI
jgi:NAD(P)-dependent dehydrogenase (short-subunit alcohol dehydrogenase family)